MNYNYCKYCYNQIESDMIQLCDCSMTAHKKCIIVLLQSDPNPCCWICSKPYNINLWTRLDLFTYQICHLFDPK